MKGTFGSLSVAWSKYKMLLHHLFEVNILPLKVINQQTAKLLRASFDLLDKMNADVSMISVNDIPDGNITCDFYCGIGMENPSSAQVKPKLNALLKKHKLEEFLDFTSNAESDHIVYEFASTNGEYTDFEVLKDIIEAAFPDQPDLLNFD